MLKKISNTRNRFVAHITIPRVSLLQTAFERLGPLARLEGPRIV